MVTKNAGALRASRSAYFDHAVNKRGARCDFEAGVNCMHINTIYFYHMVKIKIRRSGFDAEGRAVDIYFYP